MNSIKAQEFYDKVEWEGGLMEYVVDYGGEIPEELQDAANEFSAAAGKLFRAYREFCVKYDLDDIPF